MKALRNTAAAMLLLIAGFCLMAERIAPAGYEKQFRDATSAGPSVEFPLGTDELGRDRFARLLHGGRISLLLAPAAALLATLLAGVLGAVAGHAGGWWDRAIMSLADLFLSLPWLFLLLTVRALLPLNVSPAASVLITFLLLGLLGWAAPVRVVRSRVRALQQSDFLLQARAAGCGRARIVLGHLLPNLRPVLFAQFLLAVPAFVLSEANLSLLGLGVAEPLPSWGNLLRGLEQFQTLPGNPALLAPVVVLVAVTSSFQILLSKQEVES